MDSRLKLAHARKLLTRNPTLQIFVILHLHVFIRFLLKHLKNEGHIFNLNLED